MNAQRSVPFFNYRRLYLDDKEALLRIFDDTCSRGAFILQSDLTNFENVLANYTGANYAIGVANATDGLEISLMAIGLNPGDEVIFSSHTMLATAASIKIAGGVPVPVDIGEDNLIDPNTIEDAISSRTVGIIPTQLNGRTCDMDRIMGIAQKHNLFIVEDAAQALGSKFKGKCAGTFGMAASISFFPAKVLGCLGDGGAVLTQSESMFDKIYQLHDHGRDINGEVRSWGRNSRLDNLQAAFLNFRLQSYENVISRRRQIAGMYQEVLGMIEAIRLPPGPNADPNHFDVYQNYEIQAERRDNLRDYLSKRGVGTMIQWGGKAVHQFECLGFRAKLPKVERFFQNCIMLPMNMSLSDEDVFYVCEQIQSFYRG